MSHHTHMFHHTSHRTHPILSCLIHTIYVWFSIAQPTSLIFSLSPPKPHSVEKGGLGVSKRVWGGLSHS